MNSAGRDCGKFGGRVFLIGAGPGDPELLTLKAVRALGLADVILIDDLVSRDVLAHASPEARIVEVGKRGGCRSTSQAFIERLMLRLAKGGKVVARVKGGDPFMFGRGGEEMLALRKAGVPCEIVPGITAGMAVPAACGIPVTHRAIARGVTFVTGHGSDDAGPDWARLAASNTTLVIYMGVARMGKICAALLAAGMRPETPAAAIEQGTLPAQHEVVATLGTLVSRAAAEKIGSPAIIVIGDVVALARSQWSEVSAVERAA